MAHVTDAELRRLVEAESLAYCKCIDAFYAIAFAREHGTDMQEAWIAYDVALIRFRVANMLLHQALEERKKWPH